MPCERLLAWRGGELTIGDGAILRLFCPTE